MTNRSMMDTPTPQNPNPEPYETDCYELVESPQRWQEVVRQLNKHAFIAFDLESNGYYRYPDRICLIQIADDQHVFLIDPFQVGDLTDLGKILRNPKIVKIFHSCENDLRALDRDFGFRVKNIFDTAVAAHFLGAEKRGLSNVLLDFIGVTLPKSKTLQRQDWTVRPLSKRSLKYAAGDVALLVALRTIMIEALEKAGRLGWVDEEMKLLEKIRADEAVSPELMFWSVKGSKDLTDRQRGILKEIVLFRDQLCRELDRTPFRVMSDEVVLQLVKNPEYDFKKIKGLAVVFHQKKQKMLRQAILQGKQATPISLPDKKPHSGYRKKNEQTLRRLNILKSWRVNKGKEMGLDPSLLWPLVSLEVIAATKRMEKSTNDVRQWQRNEFGMEITGLITEMDESAGFKTGPVTQVEHD